MYSDNDGCPAKRQESCCNCNKKWGLHQGWACPTSSAEYYLKPKGQIPQELRYLTSDMEYELPTFPLRLECIDDSSMVLDKGKVYQCVQANRRCYYIDSLAIAKWHFKVLATTTAPISSVAPTKTHAMHWRAWRDHGKGEEECVCRIPRSQCDYHRT